MAVEESNNQIRLRQLIAQLGVTQKELADLLCQKTQRPVSYRSVKSWLADPTLKSARSCPAWPIEILTKELNNN